MEGGLLKKEFSNVILYGEATRSLLVVPIQTNYRKFGAVPIFGDSILFFKNITKVIGVVFTIVFNTKVIYHETESFRAPFVTLEARGVECLVVARIIEALCEEVIGNLVILWKAVYAFSYIELYPPLTRKVVEIIFENKFLRYI